MEIYESTSSLHYSANQFASFNDLYVAVGVPSAFREPLRFFIRDMVVQLDSLILASPAHIR
jgi:hypothetical protein